MGIGAGSFNQRKGAILLTGFLLVFLLTRALELRLPRMTEDFGDEVHHIQATLEARHLYHLRVTVAPQFQPLLDYSLKRVFWIPALGTHAEIFFRIPSLVYGLLTLLLTFAVAGVFSYRRFPRQSMWLSVFFGFLLSFWVMRNPTEIWASGIARHYTLIPLVSLLWWSLYFFGVNLWKWRFLLASFLLLNAHFFSWPIVGMAHAFDVLSEARRETQKNGRLPWKRLLKQVAVLILLFAVCIAINFHALKDLLMGPPNPQTLDGLTLVTQGVEIWMMWFRYLEAPSPEGFLILLLVGAFLFQAREKSLTPRKFFFYFCHLIFLPLFLAALRGQSNYTFSFHYFTPYFGLAIFSYLFFFQGLATLLTRMPLGPSFIYRGIPATLVGMGLLLFFSLSGLSHSRAWIKDFHLLRPPPKNFSSYYKIYSELKEIRRPLFILHDHCWADWIPKTYFEYIHPQYPYGVQIADSQNCETPLVQTQKRLEYFLNTNSKGVVILDFKGRECRKKDFPFLGEKIAQVESHPSCVFKVWGAQTLEDVQRAADAVRFPYQKALFE